MRRYALIILGIISGCACQSNHPIEEEQLAAAAAKLELAIEAKNLKQIDSLLNVGISPDVMSDAGVPMLQLAVRAKAYTAAKKLLEAGADIDQLADYAHQPAALHLAAVNGDTAAVRMLLGAGSNIDLRDGHGETALHWAVRRGDVSVINQLLRSGASIHPTGRSGSVLAVAIRSRHFDLADDLIERGAIPEVPGTTHAHLFAAVKKEDETSLQNMTLNEAAVNVRDAMGNTLLHWSAIRSNENITAFLLQEGANPNRANQVGYTPLSLAAYQGDVTLMQHLIRAGAKVNYKDARFGHYAIHSAVTGGSMAALKLLLNNKVETDVIDGISGMSPLMLAAWHGRKDMFVTLLRAGADPHLRTEDGQSMTDVLAAKGDPELIRLLQDAMDIEVEAEEE